METRIKFSDILRYILLGAVVCILFLPLIDLSILNLDSQGIILIIFIAVSFFVGLTLQSFRSLIEHNTIRFIEAGKRKKEKIKNKINRKQSPSRFSFPMKWAYYLLEFVIKTLKMSIYGSVYQVCHSLRYKKYYRFDIPYWLYLSNEPDKVLARLSNHTQNRGQEHEALHYNQLFLGISFLLVLLVCIFSCELLFNWNILPPFIFSPKETESNPNPISPLFILGMLVVGVFISRYIARLFVIEHIRNIHIAAQTTNNDKEEKGHDRLIYEALGNKIPHVYILMRTQSADHKFIDKAIESVHMQYYPKYNIILLEDPPKTPKGIKATLKNKIANINKERTENRIIHKISEEHLGAAEASIKIREHFRDIASQGDIAVLLDDDDAFLRRDALTEIVHRMNATDANICLSAFVNTDEMQYVISNKGGYIHNSIVVKDIANYSTAQTYGSYNNIVYADTLGWTKSYRYDLLQKYIDCIHEFDKDIQDKPNSKFEIFKARDTFEDFCDFICFLFKSTRITAVDRPIYEYRKHSKSIVTNATIEAFRDNRTHFLVYLNNIVKFGINHKWDFVEGALSATNKHISYKIGVICNIIEKKKIASYSGSIFKKEIIAKLADKDDASKKEKEINSYIKQMNEVEKTLECKKEAYE